MISYGLIAGMTMEEALSSSPGFVMDAFLTRRAYDDALHGITRKSKTRWEE